MKFNPAALLCLASSAAVSAFVPASFGGSKAFGIAKATDRSRSGILFSTAAESETFEFTVCSSSDTRPLTYPLFVYQSRLTLPLSLNRAMSVVSWT